MAQANERVPNGAAMAAVLSAGIGALAMGFFVILNEAGLFTAPSLYSPAGGLSGRATAAVVCWLGAWAIAHWRLRGRDVDPGRILLVTLVMVALGLLATFPPVWGLLSG